MSVCVPVRPFVHAFHCKVALYTENKSKLCEAQPRERGAFSATNGMPSINENKCTNYFSLLSLFMLISLFNNYFLLLIFIPPWGQLNCIVK